MLWDVCDLPARLRIQISAGKPELRWETGILQAAERVAGQWADLTNAVSPFAFDPNSAMKFYRVRLEP